MRRREFFVCLAGTIAAMATKAIETPAPLPTYKHTVSIPIYGVSPGDKELIQRLTEARTVLIVENADGNIELYDGQPFPIIKHISQ